MSLGGQKLRDERGVNELKIRDSKEQRRTGKGKGKSEKKKRIVQGSLNTVMQKKRREG